MPAEVKQGGDYATEVQKRCVLAAYLAECELRTCEPPVCVKEIDSCGDYRVDIGAEWPLT